MRFASRLDHDLFEATIALCNPTADPECWDTWRHLIHQGAALDRPFPIQYDSPGSRDKRSVDLSAIELMLICWPWQRLGEGLKELGPMEDVIFSSLVSIALNHGNEWYHARTINDNNPIHEYVVKPFALWCEQYKNSSNVGVPRLGWWEVLSQRWKDGFTEQLAPSIIENLIHTLPTLSPKDLGDLLFVVVEQHNNLGGCGFGTCLTILLHEPTAAQEQLYARVVETIFSQDTHSRTQREMPVLRNARVLADRARLTRHVDENALSNHLKRKM